MTYNWAAYYGNRREKTLGESDMFGESWERGGDPVPRYYGELEKVSRQEVEDESHIYGFQTWRWTKDDQSEPRRIAAEAKGMNGVNVWKREFVDGRQVVLYICTEDFTQDQQEKVLKLYRKLVDERERPAVPFVHILR